MFHLNLYINLQSYFFFSMIVKRSFLGGEISGKKALKVLSKSDMKGEKRLINFRKR